MTNISVSIVFATRQRQWIKETMVRRGACVSDLIEKSNFLNEIEILFKETINTLSVGIYAQPAELDTLLEDGDRVEIYRPLTADPKEVRRQLALLGKTMGKQP